MRLIDPKSTALVFESGKMVVLGAKSENSVRRRRQRRTPASMFDIPPAPSALACLPYTCEHDLHALAALQAKVAARKFAKIIKLCNVAEKVWFQDWKVNNLVATVDCGFPIRLEGLHLAHAKFSS